MVAVMPKILALKNRRAGELFIYDDIGENMFGAGITAKDVQAKLKELGSVETINVRINSQGGDVFDGITIYNQLRNSPARVEVDIDGGALSIASVIAMAGEEVRMAANAMMMIHEPWTGFRGNATEMRAMADRLDKVKDNLALTYSKRRDLNIDEVEAMMTDETWMKADEALRLGFIDKITDSVEVAVNLDKHQFVNAPQWASFRAGQPGSRSVYHVKTIGN